MVSQCHSPDFWFTYPLNGVALVVGDRDGLRTWGQRPLVVAAFGKKLKKLLGVLANELGKLRIACGNLLQNGLEHRGLLLHDLSKLLKLRVVTQ